MAEFLEDPSVLTKDKLKSELTANNVLLPSSEQKKDVYVQLYLKNLTVLNKKCPPSVDTFSSDEELPAPVVSNKSRSGRKATRKTDKPRSEEVEVTDLTDASSNRKLYEKKLQKLLDTPTAETTSSPPETARVTAAAKADGNQNGNTHSGQYSDKEEDEIATAPEPEAVPVVEQPVRIGGKTPVTVRNSSRWSSKLQVVEVNLATGDQTPKKTRENVEEILANEILSPTGISASCRRPIRGAAGRPVKPSDYWLNESLLERSIYTESYSECSSLGSNAPARPGFLSVLLKLMVLITVAGSIYFAIQHLDADQVQSFKGLLTDAKGLLNSAKGHLCSTVDKVVDAVVDNVIVPLGIGGGSSQSAGAESGGK
ncbi:unnamed protein product [Coregonus sp. 'balchen']|nr:unnamed protein product [Coregonus sp. 'balchen']